MNEYIDRTGEKTEAKDQKKVQAARLKCRITDFETGKDYDGNIAPIQAGNLLLLSAASYAWDQNYHLRPHRETYVKLVYVYSPVAFYGFFAGSKHSVIRRKGGLSESIYQIEISAKKGKDTARFFNDAVKGSPIEKVSKKDKIKYRLAETEAEKEAAYQVVLDECLRGGFGPDERDEIRRSLDTFLAGTNPVIGVSKGKVVAVLVSVLNSSFNICAL